MVPYPNILHLIGNTPLVELRTFDTGPCKLFVKLESQNPGGSIKDRIGRSMIEVAEREGKIGPGSVLVEATAGEERNPELTGMTRRFWIGLVLTVPVLALSIQKRMERLNADVSDEASDQLLGRANLCCIRRTRDAGVDDIRRQREIGSRAQVTLVIGLGSQAFHCPAFATKHVESIADGAAQCNQGEDRAWFLRALLQCRGMLPAGIHSCFNEREEYAVTGA